MFELERFIDLPEIEMSAHFQLFNYIILKGIGSVWSAKVVTFGDADFNQNELINQLVISPLT